MAAVEAAVIAPIKRAGGTPVLIDHVAMRAAQNSPYSISSQRKHAASDVHLRLEASGPPLTRGGAPASFTLTGQKDRPGGIERRGKTRHVGKVTFTPQPDGAVDWRVDLSAPSVNEEQAQLRPTGLMERVSQWTMGQPGLFSKRDVNENVKGNASDMRKAVDVLVGEGYLADLGKGPSQKSFQHLRVYREADDPGAVAGQT